MVNAAWKSGIQELVALVDTGFTGELKVSKETANQLGLEVTHTKAIRLGNGEIEEMAASRAVVFMEEVQEVVDVIINPGSTVIGVGLMKKFQYVLTADFPLDMLTLERKAPGSTP